MTLVAVADAGTPAVVDHEDRRQKIVDLYEAGVPTSRIARAVGVTPTRVNQIVREDIAAFVKASGTEEVRVNLFSELELVKQQLLSSLMSEDGVTSGEVSSLVRLVKTQALLVGAINTRPIEVHVDNSAANQSLNEFVERAAELARMQRTGEMRLAYDENGPTGWVIGTKDAAEA